MCRWFSQLHMVFSRFREKVGLVSNSRTVELVAPSPFDYERNCLRYLPRHPPELVNDDCGNPERYFDALTEQVFSLLDASCGHALILFTPYSLMETVEITLRGNTHTCWSGSGFPPGAVLLATGSAGEGMNFPGDQVSLLIIPKLPFAIHSALREQRKVKYGSLYTYLQNIRGICTQREANKIASRIAAQCSASVIIQP